MIEVQNVVKTFEGFRALDGLTMTVPDGSIYGLVGPNGAGKSTILRHITGIYRQDEGKVLVGKVNTDEQPELAVRFGVMSIPTVIFLKDGKEIDRKVGVMPEASYTAVLDANL